MTPTKKTSAKKTSPKKNTAKVMERAVAARRSDYGAPIEGFFKKQPKELRSILDALRELVDEAAPNADAAIKWGMPFYTLDGAMMCALAAFKSHVNLIVVGREGTIPDPHGLLEGDGKGGKHLKLRPGDAIPKTAIKGFLRAAVKNARARSG